MDVYSTFAIRRLPVFSSSSSSFTQLENKLKPFGRGAGKCEEQTAEVSRRSAGETLDPNRTVNPGGGQGPAHQLSSVIEIPRSAAARVRKGGDPVPEEVRPPALISRGPAAEKPEARIDRISLTAVCAAFIRINPACRHLAGTATGSHVCGRLGPERDARWLLLPGRRRVGPPVKAGRVAPAGGAAPRSRAWEPPPLLVPSSPAWKTESKFRCRGSPNFSRRKSVAELREAALGEQRARVCAQPGGAGGEEGAGQLNLPGGEELGKAPSLSHFASTPRPLSVKNSFQAAAVS
ncbi:uncharacterized protein LOC119510358 [Choloepus didactylus]|uniref:uncharacterized protein LOC119510358 n=1 Tax=Choloepus didactylus TaxID=27675 RepID=UPI00189EE6FC|nr:uncharacterized protein LOC119510358 [Choloepus didactylus]